MTSVQCSVCGEEVGKLGINKHAGMHRRQFREVHGRFPEDYGEVREAWPLTAPEDNATLDDFAEGSE